MVLRSPAIRASHKSREHDSISIVIVKSGPLERNWLMGDFGGVSIEHYPGPGLYALYKHSTCRLNSFFFYIFTDCYPLLRRDVDEHSYSKVREIMTV